MMDYHATSTNTEAGSSLKWSLNQTTAATDTWKRPRSHHVRISFRSWRGYVDYAFKGYNYYHNVDDNNNANFLAVVLFCLSVFMPIRRPIGHRRHIALRFSGATGRVYNGYERLSVSPFTHLYISWMHWHILMKLVTLTYTGSTWH